MMFKFIRYIFIADIGNKIVYFDRKQDIAVECPYPEPYFTKRLIISLLLLLAVFGSSCLYAWSVLSRALFDSNLLNLYIFSIGLVYVSGGMIGIYIFHRYYFGRMTVVIPTNAKTFRSAIKKSTYNKFTYPDTKKIALRARFSFGVGSIALISGIFFEIGKIYGANPDLYELYRHSIFYGWVIFSVPVNFYVFNRHNSYRKINIRYSNREFKWKSMESKLKALTDHRIQSVGPMHALGAIVEVRQQKVMIIARGALFMDIKHPKKVCAYDYMGISLLKLEGNLDDYCYFNREEIVDVFDEGYVHPNDEKTIAEAERLVSCFEYAKRAEDDRK